MDSAEKRRRVEVAKSLAEVVDAYANDGPDSAQRHAAASSDAQKEYLRYILGGSAGGIAILTSQFHQLPVPAQASSVVSIAFFAFSLRYSLLAIDARWKECDQNSLQHREWWKGMTLKITSFRSGGETVEWVDPPVDRFTAFTRWSRLARAMLIGGACSAFFSLLVSIEWDWPLWIGSIQHRLAHLLGTV